MKKAIGFLFARKASDAVILKFHKEINVGYIFASGTNKDGEFGTNWKEEFKIPVNLGIISKEMIDLCLDNPETTEESKKKLISLRASSQIDKEIVKVNERTVEIGSDFIFKKENLISIRKINDILYELQIDSVKESYYLNKRDFKSLKKVLEEN